MEVPTDYMAPEGPDEASDIAVIREKEREKAKRYWIIDPAVGTAREVRIVAEPDERYVWVSGLTPPPDFERLDRLVLRESLSTSRRQSEERGR